MKHLLVSSQPRSFATAPALGGVISESPAILCRSIGAPSGSRILLAPCGPSSQRSTPCADPGHMAARTRPRSPPRWASRQAWAGSYRKTLWILRRQWSVVVGSLLTALVADHFWHDVAMKVLVIVAMTSLLEPAVFADVVRDKIPAMLRFDAFNFHPF